MPPPFTTEATPGNPPVPRRGGRSMQLGVMVVALWLGPQFVLSAAGTFNVRDFGATGNKADVRLGQTQRLIPCTVIKVLAVHEQREMNNIKALQEVQQPVADIEQGYLTAGTGMQPLKGKPGFHRLPVHSPAGILTGVAARRPTRVSFICRKDSTSRSGSAEETQES